MKVYVPGSFDRARRRVDYVGPDGRRRSRAWSPCPVRTAVPDGVDAVVWFEMTRSQKRRFMRARAMRQQNGATIAQFFDRTAVC